MTIAEFNNLNAQQAKSELMKCCGSSAWAQKIITMRPFSELDELKELSDFAWEACTKDDYLEAFSHHPKIGNLEALEEKFASTATWACRS